MSGPVRNVTITADDFGLDRAVNAAIIHLGRSGRLHRASVLIDAPHAGDALAADLPIALGLHVDLPAPMLATATSAQIRTEMSRQWQQMVRRGRSPAHLDLHTVALYGLGSAPVRPGGVLTEAIALAAEHVVPLRLPRLLPPGLRPGPEARAGHQRLLDLADRAGVHLPRTIATDWRPPEQISDYADVRRYYRDLVQALPDGTSEIFLHPALPRAGDDDDAPAGAQARPADHRSGDGTVGGQVAARRKRRWEYQLLTGGDLHRDLGTAGVGGAARGGPMGSCPHSGTRGGGSTLGPPHAPGRRSP